MIQKLKNKISQTFIIFFCLLLISMSSCKHDQEEIITPVEPYTSSISHIWLHRCNSVEKANLARPFYGGIEVDIHYIPEQNTFSIKHDEWTPDTLFLKDFLSRVNNNKDFYYWLDFKNLDQTNKESSLLCLISIVDSLKIEHDHFIVENFASNLTGFTQNKFITSYWIPYFDPLQCTDDELQEKVDYIQEKINQYPVKRLSAPEMQLDFLNKYFPDIKKLTWLNTDPIATERTQFARQMLENESMDVILAWDWFDQFGSEKQESAH